MEVYTNNWTNRKYQIGYALSGGFIKGFAHLGVMQALLELLRESFMQMVMNLTKCWIIFPDTNFKT